MQKINLRELYPDVYKTDVFVDVAEEVVVAIRGQEQDDALPHAAAVSPLDPGDLGHRHAQVKPGVDTPGLDGGQLHQRGIHFLPQQLLLQDFLRGEWPVEGIVFNAILPVQRVVSLVPELPRIAAKREPVGVFIPPPAYLFSKCSSGSTPAVCTISFSSSVNARVEFNSTFLAAGGHER